jgi:hypothetical protein
MPEVLGVRVITETADVAVPPWQPVLASDVDGLLRAYRRARRAADAVRCALPVRGAEAVREADVWPDVDEAGQPCVVVRASTRQVALVAEATRRAAA